MESKNLSWLLSLSPILPKRPSTLVGAGCYNPGNVAG